MADQPGKPTTTPEEAPSTPAEAADTNQDTIFNSEIGDDWGEAFEAEDFVFSPDEEASNEFFIGDDGTAEFPENEKVEETAPPPPLLGSLAEKLNLPLLAPILNSLQPFLLQAQKQYRKISLPCRLALAGNIILLMVILTILSGPEEPPPAVATAPSVTLPAPDLPEPGAAQPAPDPNSGQESGAPTAREPLPDLPEIQIQEKIGKKWTFPAFLIAATTNADDQTPSLITANVTLEIQLHQGEELPVDQEIFVREIIYQFFNNQPLEELQRYSLARGELKKKLKAWLEKQWPETSISAVILDHYQIQ